MSSTDHPPLGLIGAGRVGGAIARTLAANSNWRIAAIHSISDAAHKLARDVGAQAVNSVAEVAANSQLILLAVPDGAIRSVSEALAESDLRGKTIVHTSGATPVSILESAQRVGAQIGGLHPIWPIARGDHPLPPGIVFGIEVSAEPLQSWLIDMVLLLQGTALHLPRGLDRVRYHAATVILSNYLVTLYAAAESLWQSVGIEDAAGKAALLGLAQATLNNLADQPPSQALTGPIVRGDSQTVRAHLQALDEHTPDLAAAYRALGNVTLERLAASKLNGGVFNLVQQALSEDAHIDS